MYPFNELVRSLIYFACTTHPCIMFWVSKLARYFTCYSIVHWEAAKSVAKYVSSTKYLALFYGVNDGSLIRFTNDDCAVDRENRKSM